MLKENWYRSQNYCHVLSEIWITRPATLNWTSDTLANKQWKGSGEWIQLRDRQVTRSWHFHCTECGWGRACFLLHRCISFQWAACRSESGKRNRVASLCQVFLWLTGHPYPSWQTTSQLFPDALNLSDPPGNVQFPPECMGIHHSGKQPSSTLVLCPPQKSCCPIEIVSYPQIFALRDLCTAIHRTKANFYPPQFYFYFFPIPIFSYSIFLNFWWYTTNFHN